MKTIRTNIFETNSSSTHSFSFVQGNKKNYNLSDLNYYPLYVSPDRKSYENCIVLDLTREGNCYDADLSIENPGSIACLIYDMVHSNNYFSHLEGTTHPQFKNKCINIIEELFKEKYPEVKNVILNPNFIFSKGNSYSISDHIDPIEKLHNKEFLNELIFNTMLVSSVRYEG